MTPCRRTTIGPLGNVTSEASVISSTKLPLKVTQCNRLTAPPTIGPDFQPSASRLTNALTSTTAENAHTAWVDVEGG